MKYISWFISRCIDRYEDILLEPDLEKDEIYLLVLVLSAPTHWEERRRARSVSWYPENTPEYRGIVKHVFILGTVQDPTVQVQYTCLL